MIEDGWVQLTLSYCMLGCRAWYLQLLAEPLGAATFALNLPVTVRGVQYPNLKGPVLSNHTFVSNLAITASVVISAYSVSVISSRL